MAVLDIFSKRQARERGEVPDVFVYDKIPDPLRVQLVQLVEEGIGEWYYRGNNNHLSQSTYAEIVAHLRREYGKFALVEKNQIVNNALDELRLFILVTQTERVIDALELCCVTMVSRQPNVTAQEARRLADVMGEINHRFREHGVGYEFNGKLFMRVDSAVVHAQAVKPALQLLGEKAYSAAEAEYRNAYEHYRRGNYKEAINDALKAFESTMKVIAAKRGWTFDPNDTASRLIGVMYSNGLIPEYWATHFGGLRSMLESGVPTVRNRTSGHGDGVTQKDVPAHLAGYALHMTASTIVFLVSAEKILP